MSIDFTLLESSFNDHGILEEFRNFKDAYDQLKNRTLPHCPAPTGEEGCLKKLIRQYTDILRQISLYRSIALFEGAVKAAMDENAYLLALAVRCYYESVAVLGFLHYQLKKLRFGAIDAEKVVEIIHTLLLGSRAIKSNKSLMPINVLSMIDCADKSLSSDIFHEDKNNKGYLRHEYDFFCEFAHPNFHSNIAAYDLDNVENVFRFRYGKEMRDIEFRQILSLLQSATIHIALHDAIDDILPQ